MKPETKTVEETTSRSRRSKTSKTASSPPVDETVFQSVCDILKECRDSCCTHPSFQKLDYDSKVFQVSTYWTRKAVGVKIAKEFAGSKAKEAKAAFSQVGYFSCRTSCTYTNLALAQLYVSSLKVGDGHQRFVSTGVFRPFIS